MSKKYEARIRGLVQSHICTLIESQLNDPRVVGVTITDVEVTQDTRYAKVYYSVLGSEQDRASAARGLESAAGWVSHELGRRLRTKNTPHITFVYDPSLVRGEHMAQLLDEVKQREAATQTSATQTSATQTSAAQELQTPVTNEPTEDKKEPSQTNDPE